jgi:hypothetical protein
MSAAAMAGASWKASDPAALGSALESTPLGRVMDMLKRVMSCVGVVDWWRQVRYFVPWVPKDQMIKLETALDL